MYNFGCKTPSILGKIIMLINIMLVHSKFFNNIDLFSTRSVKSIDKEAEDNRE